MQPTHQRMGLHRPGSHRPVGRLRACTRCGHRQLSPPPSDHRDVTDACFDRCVTVPVSTLASSSMRMHAWTPFVLTCVNVLRHSRGTQACEVPPPLCPTHHVPLGERAQHVTGSQPYPGPSASSSSRSCLRRVGQHPCELRRAYATRGTNVAQREPTWHKSDAEQTHKPDSKSTLRLADLRRRQDAPTAQALLRLLTASRCRGPVAAPTGP